MLSISLLGPPRVERDRSPIEVDTRKATALLAYLVITGREHRRESLAGLLWPDYDTEHARAALRRTLSTLNHGLGGRWLRPSRAVVGLDRTDLWLDVDEFRQLASGCSSHAPVPATGCALCVEACSRAATLYRGDFLAGFTLRDSPAFDDWQFFEAESLRRDFGALLDRVVLLTRARGQIEAAVEHARRRLSLDPLHEPAHGQLMELYALAGQRSSALRQYRECVAVLDRELGVAPLEATTALYARIRDGELHPDQVDVEKPPAPAGEDRGAIAPGELPLVGRKAEWDALVAAYESVGPAGRLVVLQGEAGIGKTRLAREFISDRRNHGAVTAEARGREDESHLPFGLIVSLLRSAVGLTGAPGNIGGSLDDLPARHLTEAHRLLPEIADRWPHLPPALGMDGLGAQHRFYDGVVETVTAAVAGAGTVPGILLFDDLHWADEASVELFTFLVHRLRHRPILVLATWRPEGISSTHRLHRMVSETRREGLTTALQLSRLGPGEVEELARAADLADLSREETVTRLHEETEGVPFFVVEYLAVAGSSEEGEPPFPQGVQDLLTSRVAPLGDTAQQLLGAAAVLGQSFDVELLRHVSGRSEEETVDALEELLARGLIVPSSDGSGALPVYDFSHAKIRSFVLDGTTLPRRRLLHGRAGDALVRVRPGSRGQSEHALIARHLRLGGREAEAAEHFKLAGERAAALFANSDALAHFEAALSLGHPATAALHEAMGDMQTLNGDYGSALRSYEAAAASLPEDLAGVEQKLGRLHDRLGAWSAADSHFMAALDCLSGEEGRRARILADWSLTSHHAGDDGRAEDLAGEALTGAESASDDIALAQARNILGVLATTRGDVEVAAEHLEASLELARRVGDPGAAAAALNNLALAHRSSGDLERSARLTEEALTLCAAQGDRHREAALHNNLADILHQAGRSEEAMGHLKVAVTLFAEIGEPDSMQPAIWKLVEW
jgi:DNA-binding SARP family transcriptional activator